MRITWRILFLATTLMSATMVRAAEPVNIEMVEFPSGSFQMGSNDWSDREKPVHTVQIRQFRLGKYEVTQKQWQTVMGENPSQHKGCDNCPVETVSWDDIQGFIQKLNRLTGKKYRLPSEAEWEYACRSGGKDEEYCGGSDEDSLAWHRFNSDFETHPVGQKHANGLGLYDMSGNVYEWTQDCRNDSYRGALANGKAWLSGNCAERVVRGGNGGAFPLSLRSAYRYWFPASNRHDAGGFRLAQDAP